MGAWEAVANHKIRESMAAGEFDNLKGHGKPRERDSGLDPNDANAAAHKILKNAGHLPAWVEDEKEISKQREELRQLLLRRQVEEVRLR